MDTTYSHRFNADGTIDSICHRCFHTIATATLEGDLERVEQTHCCCPEDEIRYAVLAEEGKLAWQ